MLTGSVRRQMLFVGAAAALLFLPGLGGHDLWNPDEPRYAQVAREMMLGGEYLVPHLNAQVYSHKPPLLFWSIVVVSKLAGGIDETTVRLPSALAAIGTTLLVFALGRRLFGPRAAWLSTAAFATALRILWQGRCGQIDMLLTFLVALAIYFWVRGFQEDRPLFYRLFFVVTGLATLAKGPVGLLPPLLGIVVFLLWKRDFAALRRLGVGWGLLLWLGVVLAWLVPAGLRGGWSYVEQIVFAQNVTRYVDPGSRLDMAGHLRPWYYFLQSIPVDFFPWSFFLPGALIAAWRRRRRGDGEWPAFLLTWALVTVLFFSLSPGKRNVYVLTAFPALALLVGWSLDLLAERGGGRWATIPSGLLALLVACSAGLVFWRVPREPLALVLEQSPVVWASPLLLLAPATIAAWWSACRGRVTRQVVLLTTGMAAFSAVLFLALTPKADPIKSARAQSAVLAAELEPDERFYYLRSGETDKIEWGFLFYSQRMAEALDLEQAADLAASEEEVWLVVPKEVEAVGKGIPGIVEVARDVDPDRGFVLLHRPAVVADGVSGGGDVP